MKITALKIAGVYHIEIDRLEDNRGFFARLWCEKEFQKHGISFQPVQSSMSQNPSVGTLRGMHFQWFPSREDKLVRCTRGRVHDVVLDLRPGSESFMQHEEVELGADHHNALFIPAGVGHGFQTLEKNCELNYLMSDYFDADLSDGVRFDDPAFGITWPLPIAIIADRDRNYPNFNIDAFVARYNNSLARGQSTHTRRDE